MVQRRRPDRDAAGCGDRRHALAKAYWPGKNPIGQHVQFGSKSAPIEIVGVIGHVRKDSLEVEENKGVLYRPMAQQPVDEAVFVGRADEDESGCDA